MEEMKGTKATIEKHDLVSEREKDRARWMVRGRSIGVCVSGVCLIVHGEGAEMGARREGVIGLERRIEREKSLAWPKE